MLGKRSSQRSLFDVEYHFRHLAGEDSFHWQLSQVRDQLFRDEEFAALYTLDNGRPSVPPSLLATALLLQAHDKVSDAEAHRRTRLDLGWKVALGVEADAKPFAQSTLQHFRAQLILHDQIQAVFLSSLELAREKGLLKGPALHLVLDTTPILGRGAVANRTLVNGDPYLTNDTVAAGRRHSPTVAHPSPSADAGHGPLGRAGGLRPLPGTQHQGERRGRLKRSRGAARVPGSDRGRLRTVAGPGPDLTPSDRPRAPGPTTDHGRGRVAGQAAVAGH